MTVAGLIVAAGRGRRLGGDLPKQYADLGGEAVLARAARALLAHPGLTRLLVVIHPGDRALYDAAMAAVAGPRVLSPVAGGTTRAASVLAGLEALAEAAPAMVLVHDAARPFVSPGLVAAVAAALDEADGAFPALPVVDALWRGGGGEAEAAVPREGLWRAQTPQGFRFAPILAAHRAQARAGAGEAADDVAVARAAGLTVRIVPGEESAFKITTAVDLARARGMAEGLAQARGMTDDLAQARGMTDDLAQARGMAGVASVTSGATGKADRARARGMAEGAVDVRTGQGFDVHAFGPGDHVMLCGVAVPHERGLVGHSDADVGLHALTDAIFGALAEGDIGRWFPPGEPEWKGAASAVFLAKAVERAAARGFAITHLDVTLICERPKVGPHAGAMQAEVARLAGLAPDRVGIKATTSERLGFTGRGEGIAALAVATLVRAPADAASLRAPPDETSVPALAADAARARG